VKTILLALNSAFLFACASMYFGTGWSEILFSFPIVPQLTPANYYLAFVPEVAAATHFFTGMTIAMLVSAIIMAVAEWRTGYLWAPVVVLLAVIAATVLTERSIFPLNAQMSAGIKDAGELQGILAQWTALNRVRVWMWTAEWAAMMAYFACKARPATQEAP